MNRMLSQKEVAELTSSLRTMTRTDKLLRLAQLARGYKGKLYIYHLLECWTIPMLKGRSIQPYIGVSVFMLMQKDPIFKDAGFVGTSIYDAMTFLELSQEELHEFSCDCGGELTSKTMAARIEKLAGVTPVKRLLNRFSH